MSSRRMTSIVFSLHRSRKRQQRDIAGFENSVRQAPLVRCAYSGDTPWNDLAALGDKGLQHLDVFVVDVIDLLDAEAAHFLAPEILFLPDRGGLVTARGALRRSNGSSTFLFWHCEISLFRLAPLATGGQWLCRSRVRCRRRR